MIIKNNKFIEIVIPEFERKIQLTKKSKKTGKPKFWTINGQSLYNATMHYRTRSSVTAYFHKYMSKYIKEQVSKEDITLINLRLSNNFKLSISLDIYEVKKGNLPDISNLWLWIKWFEDALQECEIIPDDNPDYIIESGKKRYYWVENEDQRKLVFKISFINV